MRARFTTLTAFAIAALFAASANAQATKSVTCADGTTSTASGKGACSGHGGVKKADKTEKTTEKAAAKTAKTSEKATAKNEKTAEKATAKNEKTAAKTTATAVRHKRRFIHFLLLNPI